MKLKNCFSYLGLTITLFLVLACGMCRDAPPPKTFNAQDFNPYRGKLENLLEKTMGTYYGEKYGLKKITPQTVPGAVEAVKADYEISASWGSSYAPRPLTVELENYPTAEAAANRMRETERRLNLWSEPYIVKNQQIGRVLITDKGPHYWTNGSLFCKTGDWYFQRLAKF